MIGKSDMIKMNNNTFIKEVLTAYENPAKPNEIG